MSAWAALLWVLTGSVVYAGCSAGICWVSTSVYTGFSAGVRKVQHGSVLGAVLAYVGCSMGVYSGYSTSVYTRSRAVCSGMHTVPRLQAGSHHAGQWASWLHSSQGRLKPEPLFVTKPNHLFWKLE